MNFFFHVNCHRREKDRGMIYKTLFLFYLSLKLFFINVYLTSQNFLNSLNNFVVELSCNSFVQLLYNCMVDAFVQLFYKTFMIVTLLQYTDEPLYIGHTLWRTPLYSGHRSKVKSFSKSHRKTSLQRADIGDTSLQQTPFCRTKSSFLLQFTFLQQTATTHQSLL